MHKHLILTCSLLGLLACTPASTLAIVPPDHTNPHITPAQAVKLTHQLTAAKLKWQQKKPPHYAYTLRHTCFCPPEYTQPLEIRVSAGVIQQATLLTDQKPLPPERKAEAKTVKALFAIIQNAIDRKAASIVVKYDANYGFPTSISIDLDARMADEEIYYTVSDFKIASGLKPAQ